MGGIATDPRQVIAELKRKLNERTVERDEALQRQTATAEILKVIASSTTDVQPVFEAIAERSNRLIRGSSTSVFSIVDDMMHLSAFTRTNPAADAALKTRFPSRLSARTWGEQIRNGETVLIPDTEADGVMSDDLRESARMRGYRSMLQVPLLRERMLIGLISITKVEPGPFSADHVQLLQTFADQAVIAIENVRLFDEVRAKTRDLTEALTYQTGSSKILSVIASSPTDVGPVLRAIVESACELCDAIDAIVLLNDGDRLRTSAHHGPIPLDMETWPISRKWTSGRAFLDRKPVRVHDLLSAEGDEFPETRQRTARTGTRSILSLPLLREGKSIGTIVLRRTEVHPFSDKQVALLQTFADQAVIAIGNVRLFDEVQTKTRELSEALTYQIGSENILRVIASSPTDVGPVLQAIVERACELCEAYDAVVRLKAGDELQLSAHHGPIPADSNRWLISRHWTAGRAVIEKKPVHVHDLLSAEGDDFPEAQEIARQQGHRTVLSVPMLREGESIGAIVLRRIEVHPFSDKQIALLQTFADQAVIAIDNVRMFEEVQERTRDLAVSLEQQTATSEVLQIISSTPEDLELVFQKMLENATRVCEAKFGTMILYEGDLVRRAALYNVPPAFAALQNTQVWRPHPESGLSRIVKTKQVTHVDDLRTQGPYLQGDPMVVALSDIAGARTIVMVPMLKENELIGAISIYRQEVKPFTDKQIALVSNFANQAVIAIENTRLLKELRQRTDDLTASLQDLRTAQDRLVQTQKLASLGQLTAGIAHEIKNPLNFVNNFSALSAELTGELNDLLKPVALDRKVREDVDELTGMLKDNLEKVVQHGKRADSIVKNMLRHSREGSGEHRPSDINAIVDESLNLAYHGARAEKAGFSIALRRDLDPSVGIADVYPQEITRVLLNLISNGFYATTKRKVEAGDGFEPMLSATTKNLGDKVEIRIRDNGTGIPKEVKEKIFNPFFTTKPSGEGTGLGLSMSHDIIVKQHGGSIDVETEPGLFTEFRIVLPRTSGG